MAEQWGVWVKWPGGCGSSAWGTWNVSREDAEAYAAQYRLKYQDRRYEVRPYPSAPPLPCITHMFYDVSQSCSVCGKTMAELNVTLGRMTYPVAPPPIDVATLARAIHATDVRVLEFCKLRGDGIDAEKVWRSDEGGWAGEAIARATSVCAIMKGGGK